MLVNVALKNGAPRAAIPADFSTSLRLRDELGDGTSGFLADMKNVLSSYGSTPNGEAEGKRCFRCFYWARLCIANLRAGAQP